MNSAPPAIRSISSRRRRSSSSSIRVCVGSPGTFSTRKWRVRDARDLRKVRDREHLRALGEPLQRRRRPRAPSRRRCPRRSRRRRASRRRRPRRARARCARARRPTRSPRPARTGDPAFGRTRNVASSAPGRAGLALAELDEELALAHPERPRARPRQRSPSGFALPRASSRSASASAVMCSSACATALVRPPRRGHRPSARRSELALAPRRPARAARRTTSLRTGAEIGDRLQPLLDALERARLGVERRDEAVEVAAGLAQPNGEVAQLLRSRAELGRDALERRESPFREGRERRCALALVRRDRDGRRARRLGELLDVPKALAAREELLLVSGRHAFGCVDERLQLGERERDRIGVARELVVPAPCGEELAPGEPRLAAPLQLLRSAERIEDVELERRPREATLLELAGHRDETLDRGRDVLARDRTAPRVRARAPVAEDPSSDDEPRLALGPQLRERARAPPRRRSPPARRAPPRRTPRCRRRRPTRHRPARRGAARSPARRSSCPPPSRP